MTAEHASNPCRGRIAALSRRLLALLVAASLPCLALARPPEHAPAHGWRAKQGKAHQARVYVGYSGRHWERDYGVLAGTCLWRDVGTVVGAAAGAAVGAQVGAGQGRALAVFVGSVLGAAIGNRVGADLDGGDRGCLGHALELAVAGQPVRWTNRATGVAYTVVPLQDPDRGTCRRFELERRHDGASERTREVACRDATGAWRIGG
ncbi:MAG: glycine zipper 2TM domain-containing protein [Burkholderiales bacterium]|nr:MAG: glycine zipper 2TM domain-containing protein [Burkholderiales bacterium]